MRCVSVRYNIPAFSNLLSLEISTQCLFSDLVFKSASFKELLEANEVVKVDNRLSFRNLWYSRTAFRSALIADKMNEPIR